MYPLINFEPPHQPPPPIVATRQPSAALPPDDDTRFVEVLELIEAARNRAYQAVNVELLSPYWQLHQREDRERRVGDGVVDELAAALARRYTGLMTANAQRVLAVARKLSTADRAELFERLGAELEAADGGLLSQPWRDELHERIARIDAGETELIDAEELERELWAEQLADETSTARR